MRGSGSLVQEAWCKRRGGQGRGRLSPLQLGTLDPAVEEGGKGRRERRVA